MTFNAFIICFIFYSLGIITQKVIYYFQKRKQDIKDLEDLETFRLELEEEIEAIKNKN